MQAKIDYKLLRRISPEAARTAVLQYLESNNHNITDCAKIFGITRVVIYDILTKEQLNDLKDRSKAPKRVSNKTSSGVEKLVIGLKKDTKFGPKRLQERLREYHQVKLAYGTIRGILRRNGY